MRRRIVFCVILLVLVLTLVELLAWCAAGLLTARGYMAYWPNLDATVFATSSARRNPVLGWGPPVGPDGKVKALQPRFPCPADTKPALAFYGDSFTFGDGVEGHEAYSECLARMLAQPILNFGVPGYGSDQACMLFEAQVHLDPSPVVCLAHLSENVLRNVNQYRNLIYPGPGSELGFKPRFVGTGNLRQLPAPVTNFAEFQRAAADPSQGLPHEFYLNRVTPRFPYSIALARWLATDYHWRAYLSGEPRYLPFYAADHPSGALPLTVAIAQRFIQTAQAHGKRGFILLLATGPDLVRHQQGYPWPDEPLRLSLENAGIPTVHGGRLLARYLGARPPDELFIRLEDHFNEAGHKVLAAELRRELTERKLLPPGSTPAAAGPAGEDAAKSPAR